jgi:hypothetical protein
MVQVLVFVSCRSPYSVILKQIVTNAYRDTQNEASTLLNLATDDAAARTKGMSLKELCCLSIRRIPEWYVGGTALARGAQSSIDYLNSLVDGTDIAGFPAGRRLMDVGKFVI